MIKAPVTFICMKGSLFRRHICLSCFKVSVGPQLLSIYSNQLQFKRWQASFNCRIIWHVQFSFMVAVRLELRQVCVKYGRRNTFITYNFYQFCRQCFVSCWFEIQFFVTHWWIVAKKPPYFVAWLLHGTLTISWLI